MPSKVVISILFACADDVGVYDGGVWSMTKHPLPDDRNSSTIIQFYAIGKSTVDSQTVVKGQSGSIVVPRT
jgi:hypothetical protein